MFAGLPILNCRWKVYYSTVDCDLDFEDGDDDDDDS